MGLFNGCYSSIETSTAIHDVANEVASIGVTGTPTLYIDGKQFDYTGPASLIQGIQSRLPTQVPPAAPTIASTP
jgi:protein-disulfide isomerase